MGDDGTIWLPEQASTIADDVDVLFNFVNWVSFIIFVGVIGAALYFIYKYRRRSATERPERLDENKLIEVAWIIVPTILVLVVFTWGFQTFIKMGTTPPNAYQITVTGEQWNWKFTYPNGTSITNELHVPANRPVQLKMSSTDVLHSFFVPVFRVKQDVLPNRYTYLWFEATKTGTYKAFCAEYCGTQHSAMDAEVVVHEQGEGFQSWLETAGGAGDMPPAEYGKVLYERQGCNACHSLDGSAGTGPSFQGLYGTKEHQTSAGAVMADENYLRESILKPGAKIAAGYANVMPASYSSLSEQKVTALVAFLEEQSDKTVEPDDPPLKGSAGAGQ